MDTTKILALDAYIYVRALFTAARMAWIETRNLYRELDELEHGRAKK